jgi:hypothetical protein
LILFKSTGNKMPTTSAKQKFGTGARPDRQEINKPKTDHGSMNLFKKGGNVKSDIKQDKEMADKEIKKAFKEHDSQEHKGQKGTKISLKKGGGVQKYAAGGKIQQMMNKQLPKGIDKKGIVPESKQMGMIGMKSGGMAKVRKTEIVKMATGGSVKEARMEPAKMNKIQQMDTSPAKKESRLEPAKMSKVRASNSYDGIAQQGRTKTKYY